MSNPIFFKITNSGKNAILDTKNTGITLRLSHLAIGSGKYTVTGDELALNSEIARFAIISGDVEPTTHTLRFSSILSADTETSAYEIGLMTEDNILFAVVSSTDKPLVKIYPDVKFVASFGLTLDEYDIDNITVVNDPNGALSITLMENHLAHPDPHPQYLNIKRFQMLMRSLVPIGYHYHTHETINPKPLFDELLGVETFWRRITGKIIVATDPSDPFIDQVGLVLGQKGMTELARQYRPHVYPLQTTNIFERYDPNNVVETVWSVNANKESIDEGDGVKFTITANNIPDGQILQWSIKEGQLNAQSNDINNPEKTDSGTVIIKNGQATINFVTTPDDNEIEVQKHVRLTISQPANLTVNIPINDLGFSETVVRISQSTQKGIVLDEYFKQQQGSYAKPNARVRFLIDNHDVDIVAPSVDGFAIETGDNWHDSNEIIVENHGYIMGRGGKGGRNFTTVTTVPKTNGGEWTVLKPNPQNGQDGGTAIKATRPLIVENHNIISGGGGGGGAMGGWITHDEHKSSMSSIPTKNPVSGGGGKYTAPIDMFEGSPIYGTVGLGGGAGGGAPFGKRAANEHTIELLKDLINNYDETIGRYINDNDRRYCTFVDISKQGGVYSLVYYTNTKDSDVNEYYIYKMAVINNLDENAMFGDNILSNDESTIIRFYNKRPDSFSSSDVLQYRITLSRNLYDNIDPISTLMQQSGNGANRLGGRGGWLSNISNVDNIIRVGTDILLRDRFAGGEYPDPVDLSVNRGGHGGNIGEDGEDGVLTQVFVSRSSNIKPVGHSKPYNGSEVYRLPINHDCVQELIPPAKGGKAGYVYQGNVTIKNIGDGAGTLGRNP